MGTHKVIPWHHSELLSQLKHPKQGRHRLEEETEWVDQYQKEHTSFLDSKASKTAQTFKKKERKNKRQYCKKQKRTSVFPSPLEVYLAFWMHCAPCQSNLESGTGQTQRGHRERALRERGHRDRGGGDEPWRREAVEERGGAVAYVCPWHNHLLRANQFLPTLKNKQAAFGDRALCSRALCATFLLTSSLCSLSPFLPLHLSLCSLSPSLPLHLSLCSLSPSLPLSLYIYLCAPSLPLHLSLCSLSPLCSLPLPSLLSPLSLLTSSLCSLSPLSSSFHQLPASHLTKHPSKTPSPLPLAQEQIH